MDIPSVGFNSQLSEYPEFEVIDLQSLYKRSFSRFHPDKPHRVQFFNLIYITAATGHHMIDFEDYTYCDQSVIFVQREQVQAFHFSSEPQGKLIIFTQKFLDQLHANMRLPRYTPTHLNPLHQPTTLLDTNNNIRCHVFIEQIMTEIKTKDSSTLIVMYTFCALSLLLARINPDASQDTLNNKQSIKFARFIELLFVHYKKVRDAKWYAQEINTTYKTLNQLCKLATNLTAKQLIDAYTLLEIKRQLAVSNSTTQQVAYDFHFDDASNCVKYFKKHTGLTPNKFKKRFQS